MRFVKNFENFIFVVLYVHVTIPYQNINIINGNSVSVSIAEPIMPSVIKQLEIIATDR